jgi:uncharacterized pyridoxamine 5'-phosphate oxidase family protein
MHSVAIVLLGMAIAGGDAGKCPISGKPAKEENFLDVNGKKVYFCCENCPKAYAKKIGLTDDGPKNCPVSGKPAKAETKLIREGAEMVYFCCNNCPKKYNEKEKLEVADKGPKTCAACDKPASAEHSIQVNAEKVYFCCENCQKGYLKGLHVVDKGPDKCPISNHEAKKETGIVRVKSEAVYFCCNNCRGKYIADNFKEEKEKKDEKKPAKKID